MKAQTHHPLPHRPGPAPFVCCYVNGQPDQPPLLLALDSAADVSGLLLVAGRSMAETQDDAAMPTVAFHPDGTVLPKVSKCRSIAPGSMLILGCGEAFAASSVPARARRMQLTQHKRQRELGPLVRAPPPPRPSSPLPGIHSRRAEPLSEPLHESPWKFSPSGRWESPLALRPDRL